jgi:hypothetical protein
MAMKDNLIKTAYYDENGNLKEGYLPLSKTGMYHDNPNKVYSKELEDYKLRRIRWLEEKIKETEQKLKDETLSDWDRLRYQLFHDQLQIDLREDRLMVEHKGVIPDVINKRCIKRAEEVHKKYATMLGKEKALELFEDVNVTFWETIVIDRNTTGGGKVE